MAPVTYFVRMVAKQGEADAVLELLLENPRRIEERLRPLVDPASVIFGNCHPVKVLGYQLPD